MSTNPSTSSQNLTDLLTDLQTNETWFNDNKGSCCAAWFASSAAAAAEEEEEAEYDDDDDDGKECIDDDEDEELNNISSIIPVSIASWLPSPI